MCQTGRGISFKVHLDLKNNYLRLINNAAWHQSWFASLPTWRTMSVLVQSSKPENT